jgi:superfamily II DNA or RNA helicase
MDNKYNNCIYMLKHVSAFDYNNLKCTKIGSSKHLISRMYSYKTYYPIDKIILCYFHIHNYDCYQLDDDIKVDFDSQRVKSSGGIEYYFNIDSSEIEQYLIKRNIEYTRYLYGEEKELTNENKIQLCKEIASEYQEYSRYLENKNSKKDLRNEIQDKYVKECIDELNKNSKVFIKAPTGFGKTHIFYKIIKKIGYKKILILTPRLLLNEQIVEKKYTSYITDDNFKILHFSDISSELKENLIESLSIIKSNYIITSCYQSNVKLLEYIIKYKIIFDLIIYDEAHFITSDLWIENEFLINNTICKKRIFGSATPVEIIESNPQIYGKIIEKVKVYELINEQILCNIQTIVKKLDNKKLEYHNLKDLIIESFEKYKKKKGIVYVNSRANAQSLYRLMKLQDKINSYIYVSGEVEVLEESHTDITIFESDNKPCVIIVVGKISYGYDCPMIDFLILGDSRQSDIEIRQIIGRGIRLDAKVYPNKLLHLLVPLYKDEFDKYNNNEHLKKYLDYIIGECGQDIIIKGDGTGYIGNGKSINIDDGKDYDGDTIPIEILETYCTTGYNKYTDFQRFLKNNKIFDEVDYNELWEKHKSWMVPIKDLKKKYPKFGFQNIHWNKNEYYLDKNTAIEKFQEAKNTLKKNIGLDKFSDMLWSQQIKKIILIDNKIPPIDLDLYYP